MEEDLKPNEEGAACVLNLKFYADGQIAIKTHLPVKEVIKCLHTIIIEIMYKDLESLQKKQDKPLIVRPELFVEQRNEHH